MRSIQRPLLHEPQQQINLKTFALKLMESRLGAALVIADASIVWGVPVQEVDETVALLPGPTMFS